MRNWPTCAPNRSAGPPTAEDILRQWEALPVEERRRLCTLFECRPDLTPGFELLPVEFVRDVVLRTLRNLVPFTGKTADELIRVDKRLANRNRKSNPATMERYWEVLRLH